MADSIITTENPSVVVVSDTEIQVITVGIAGPAGSGDKTYRHVQSVASASWTVTHNLHKRPSVSIVDSAGDLVLGNVRYDSDNQVTLTFSSSFSGEAYCN